MANGATVLRNALVARPGSGVVEARDCVLMPKERLHQRHEVELRGHSVLPALINAHDHLHRNNIPPLRGQGLFANSYAWSAAFQSHFECSDVKSARMVPAQLRHWQGGLKNTLCGATTVMHHDALHPIFDDPNFPTRTVRPYGWAHSLHLKYGPPVAESFGSTPADVGWFIHLAEGVDDIAARELRELASMGCLRNNTVLIHGVGLGDADVRSVVTAGAGVVWCPSSNLNILGQTISPGRLRALFDSGCLTLGTDSRLSGALDLLEELQTAACHSDFSPHELLQLITVQAQRLLRCANADNDVIIFRSLSADPFADLLKLQRHELRAVVRDGEPVIADLDFEGWFARRGIACTYVQLDGRPKLCASAILSPAGAPSISLEPGLTFR